MTPVTDSSWSLVSEALWHLFSSRVLPFVRNNWGEPERAPPGQFNGCAVYLYIYIYISHNIVRRPHVITCSARAYSMWSRSQICKRLSFLGLHLRDRESDAACTCRDSSCGWYGLPGRSIERIQASSSDKLAGGSKHM